MADPPETVLRWHFMILIPRLSVELFLIFSSAGSDVSRDRVQVPSSARETLAQNQGIEIMIRQNRTPCTIMSFTYFKGFNFLERCNRDR